MAPNFEIIVGTYEQFLLGYKVLDANNIFKLERSFATHSHLASIRSVACCKHYLASAGADDSIFLYDMRYRVESGRLMHHTDTINCLAFTPEASHLLSASSDGSIGIVRCGNWQLEKHWTAPHKGLSVNALTVHPTGKLALSTGGDGVLKTWNLVKGRQAYATNLVPRLKLEAKNVMIVKWSPDGEKYLLVSNSHVDVYSVATAGLIAEITFGTKVVCAEFIDNDRIVTGHEDGKIRVYDLVAGIDSMETEAHDVRVKCLAHRDNYLVSASSSGEIKIWSYGKKKLNMLSRATCGARITCMTLTHPCPDLTVKREVAKVQDSCEVKKKNVFRMRQEVIVEDEADEEEQQVAKKRKKGNKKPEGRKRAAEEASEEVDEPTEVESILKKKKKKKKTAATVAEDVDLPKKNKRSLSVEQSSESPGKKLKKVVSKDATRETIPASQNGKFQVEEEAEGKKNKKSTKKVISSIEKPSKPVSKKRKRQNVISSTSGFPTKTKKKKLAR